MANNQKFFNPRKPVKKPAVPIVKNPEAEELITRYLETKDLKTLDELSKKIRNASVLVPAVVNEGTKQASPAVLKGKDDQLFLSAYTCREQMVKAPKTPNTMIIPFFVLADAAVKAGAEISGIALNPFSQNLILRKKLLELMLANKSVLDEPQPQVKKLQLTEEQANLLERLQFENTFLPKKFFEEGTAVFDEICEKKEDKIDELYEESYRNKRLYLYRTDEFNVFSFQPDDDIRVLRIDMPARGLNEMCAYKVYMILKEDEKYYFLISRGRGKDPNRLIRVLPDGKQTVIGEAPAEGKELFDVLSLCGIEVE